jgi:predicted RNA-binding Zn-ribbon protein involved in translation (DUF1610 family)
MMLSGIEWGNCDTCPRRFAVLHGVVRHTCPDCETDNKAMGRESAERQRWHAEKTETTRKGGRPAKYTSERERRRAERQQGAERQRAFRASQRNGKPPRKISETKDLQRQNLTLSHTPLSGNDMALKTAPIAEKAGVTQ